MCNKIEVRGCGLNNILLSSRVQDPKEVNNNFKSEISLNYLGDWE